MMKTLSAAALVSLQLAIMGAPPADAAETVPKLNVNSSCQAEAAVAPEGKRQCLKDEENARKALTQQWGKFRAADRRQCTRLATLGGTASYVELLTCLQMAVDARKLPSKDKQ
jgi:hypothetical protein